MPTSSKPLKHFRILNTRPKHQSYDLLHALQPLGAKIISCATLTIEPCPGAWKQYVMPLEQFNEIIFTSANAVEHFFNEIPLRFWPATLCPIAIGKSTFRHLATLNIHAQLPDEAHSEAILNLAQLTQPQNKKILIVKGRGGRTLLQQTLTDRGALVHLAEVYERLAAPFDPSLIQQIWQDDLIDIILITSQEGMEQLHRMFEGQGWMYLQTKPCLVISERLAAHARNMGFESIFVTSPNHVIEGLLQAHHQLTQGLKHHD